MHSITFRYARADFVALTLALSRPTWRNRLVSVAIFFALMLGVMAVTAGSLEMFGRLLSELVTGGWPLWFYVIVVAGVPFLLFGYLLSIPIAMQVYPKNAVADQEITIALDGSGISSEAPGLAAQIGWAAVEKVIETKDHLFLAISRREAVALPRRAVDGDAAFDAIRAYVCAHIGKDVDL